VNANSIERRRVRQLADENNIGVRALRFLDAQKLDHSPDNYAFAYRYLLGADRVFSDAVDHEIEGGVRLRQEAVRALMTQHALPLVKGAFDRPTMQLLDLLTRVTSATSELNQDLTRTAAELVSADPQHVRKLVIFMIERTAEAETSFSAALQQAKLLRDTLNGVHEGTGRDPLTGLPGHESMVERLEASIAAAGNCSIAIIDVDHLDGFVEAHGPEIRDRLLKAAAITLTAACSPYQVGRWGSASFMTLIDEPDLATGIAKLELACADMAARQLKLRETDEPLGQVTLSAGVATTRGRSGKEVAKAAVNLARKARRLGGNHVLAEAQLIAIPSR
jgi:diguanylate cyclase